MTLSLKVYSVKKGITFIITLSNQKKVGDLKV